MTLRPREGMGAASGPYPERPGEPDCVYYARTGLCGFGMNCRFNHPPNQRLVVISTGEKEDFPERIGLPECQYFLKTGTCKFGASCKFHHPREKTGSAVGQVQLNFLGLPLRPGEKDCTYYLRTGSCKYGLSCKFHHPQPGTVGTLMPISGSPLYTSGSPSAPASTPYQAGLPTWLVARTPYLHGPRLPGPSSYMPVIVSPRSISIPGWNTYQGAISSVPSPNGRQEALGTGFLYGTGQQQIDPASGGMRGNMFPIRGTGHSTLHVSMTQRDAAFPERPGQPDCHYYMKTGECKFGAGCRYHHPKERDTISTSCTLSVIGLPLRPNTNWILELLPSVSGCGIFCLQQEQPACTFYIKYGICKFGPTCKFDHPVGGLPYNSSPSMFLDMPVAAYPRMSSPNTTLVPASSDISLEVSKAQDLTSAPKDPINNASDIGELEEVSSMAASQGAGATTAS